MPPQGIDRHLLNANEVPITDSGTLREQFMHYLGEKPQFKKQPLLRAPPTR